MKKRDLKTLAILGLASGALLSTQLQAAADPSLSDTTEQQSTNTDKSKKTKKKRNKNKSKDELSLNTNKPTRPWKSAHPFDSPYAKNSGEEQIPRLHADPAWYSNLQYGDLADNGDNGKAIRGGHTCAGPSGCPGQKEDNGNKRNQNYGYGNGSYGNGGPNGSNLNAEGYSAAQDNQGGFGQRRRSCLLMNRNAHQGFGANNDNQNNMGQRPLRSLRQDMSRFYATEPNDQQIRGIAPQPLDQENNDLRAQLQQMRQQMQERVDQGIQRWQQQQGDSMTRSAPDAAQQQRGIAPRPWENNNQQPWQQRQQQDLQQQQQPRNSQQNEGVLVEEVDVLSDNTMAPQQQLLQQRRNDLQNRLQQSNLEQRLQQRLQQNGLQQNGLQQRLDQRFGNQQRGAAPMPFDQSQQQLQRQNQPQNQILQRQNQLPINNSRSIQGHPIQSGRPDVLSANEAQYPQQIRQGYQQSNQNNLMNQRDNQQQSFWQRGQAPQPVDSQHPALNKNDSQQNGEEKGFFERLKERFQGKEQGSAIRPVDGDRAPSSAWEQQSTQEKMQDRMNRLQERAQQQINKNGDKSLSDNYSQSKDGYNSQIRRGNQPANAQPNSSQPANPQDKNGAQPSSLQIKNKANDLSQADQSSPILHKGKSADSKNSNGKDSASCAGASSCSGK